MEQKVKELQVRIGNLMIVIVDHVTPKDEEGSKEAVVNTGEGIEEDIKELLRCGLCIMICTASDDTTALSGQSTRI